MEEEANETDGVTIYKPNEPVKKSPSVRIRKSTAAQGELSSQEIRTLEANLKEEQKKRADAEKALKLSQTDLEKTRKIAFTAQKTAGIEINNAKKAAEAEMSKLKVEFNRDRANTLKLQGDSRKEVTVLTEKLGRAEKSLAEKTSAAAERSRQIASLRMELSREKVKNAKITSGDFGSVPNGQFGLQPAGGQMPVPNKMPAGELGQAVVQIQQMLAELLFRLRAAPMPYAPPPGAPYPPPSAYPPPYPPPPFAAAPYAPPPPSYSPVDPYSFSGMKSQQDAMAAQINSIQMQQQEQFAEITRQQLATEDRIVRRQKEFLEELTNKQVKVMGDIERLTQDPEEETHHNPSVDELADSINSTIELRGGVVPAVSLSDFLKTRGNNVLETRVEETAEQNLTSKPEEKAEPKPAEEKVEVYEKKKVKDPLDDLIENLSRELNGLKSQLSRLNKINDGE